MDFSYLDTVLFPNIPSVDLQNALYTIMSVPPKGTHHSGETYLIDIVVGYSFKDNYSAK